MGASTRWAVRGSPDDRLRPLAVADHRGLSGPGRRSATGRMELEASHAARDWWRRRAHDVSGPVPTLGSSPLMSVSNSKNAAPTHADFEWAGAVARIRRGGGSFRSGRRSALLGVLTAIYANTSRGGRPVETRAA